MLERWLMVTVLTLAGSGLGWAQAPVAGQPAADSTASATPTDAEQLEALVKARGLILAGHCDQALSQCLEPALAQYRQRYAGEKRRIYCARNPTESLYYLLKAAKDKTESVVLVCHWAEAHFMRGYALVDLGRMTEAKASFQAAINLAPANSQFLGELAHCYQVEKAWDRSLALFLEAEEGARTFSPEAEKVANQGRALRGQGYALVELGRLAEAAAAYRKALALDSKDSLAQAELDGLETQAVRP